VIAAALEGPPNEGERNEPMSQEAKAMPYIATFEEGPAYWQVGILWVMLATGEQTGGEYSLMWELCPKGSGATPHYHDQDEQFYVIDGKITYLANGKELEAKAGSFVLIPRGTVHSFRVDSETATLLNSYTPAGFERTITELAEPAQARTIPPADRPPMAADWETFANLFAEIGMHPVQEPDVLREGRGEV
jgi:quercetin dioxygenase-like cupin family protein